MSRKRTTVFAEEEDLAVLKDAASHRGIPEAELIREAIHLAAMANRTWSQPFFTRTYVPQGEANEAEDALERAWREKAEAYERSKNSAP